MLAATVVFTVMDELATFRGCDIKEIVEDDALYCDILDALIERVNTKLYENLERFLEYG